MSESMDERIREKGYWRVVIRPVGYQRDRLVPLQKCKEVVEKAAVSLRGWSYPYHSGQRVDTGLDYLESVVETVHTLEHWRMYQSGQFTSLLTLREDVWPGIVPMKGLEVINTLYCLTEFYEFTSRLAEQGLFPQGAALQIGMHNVRGRVLFRQQAWTTMVSTLEGHVCGANDLPRSLELSEKDILGRAHDLAIEHALWIFERFNWSTEQLPKMLREEQEKFLKRLF